VSLHLIGVSHAYRAGRPVLDHVDLEIDADDSVAILGPSGSGKTTLLSIIGGLLRPTLGGVCLDGQPVVGGQVPPSSFSWIFQAINLLPHRSAQENVALGLLAAGRSWAEALPPAVSILGAMGLAGREGEAAMKLSGGEAQRVGVARALVGGPRYVLADEPTGQLDRATSDLVARILFAMRPPGTSLVTATHDPLIAAKCNRRYLLIDGRLRQEG
jgi:ABC-type lipoprotein export system ATPase subunit